MNLAANLWMLSFFNCCRKCPYLCITAGKCYFVVEQETGRSWERPITSDYEHHTSFCYPHARTNIRISHDKTSCLSTQDTTETHLCTLGHSSTSMEIWAPYNRPFVAVSVR
ncbi:hypothetical protein M514_17863 [Trichuris suis]|uniref:Secreted protein n=1 Tax=Trichuris suis TaxID=68888 RepID=A0A085NKK8_9BILA|nr:hypothetical protein M514_17863 [Trichuris suis]